jgi:hypothetical protein
MRPDLEQGVFVCDYCGSEFVPPPEADGVLVLGESTQECPVCALRLSNGSLEMYTIKYCTGCHGMLIAMDGLVGLVQAASQAGSSRAVPWTPRDICGAPPAERRWTGTLTGEAET